LEQDRREEVARELAKFGRSVLLLERFEIIGEPNFSTAGTPNETMKVFDLPKKVTDCEWSSILLASKNQRRDLLKLYSMQYSTIDLV
jgi:flavin-dependent dehydrogenase